MSLTLLRAAGAAAQRCGGGTVWSALRRPVGGGAVATAAAAAIPGNGVAWEQRRFRSNRSRRGLYDGRDVRSGNNLSFSMKATKRTFKPNVFTKRVYSEVLDEMVPFHLTTAALRSIDKAGGLDNYLLTSAHVTSGEGLQVKKRILGRLKLQSRQAAAASAAVETSEDLGLPGPSTMPSAQGKA